MPRIDYGLDTGHTFEDEDGAEHHLVGYGNTSLDDGYWAITFTVDDGYHETMQDLWAWRAHNVKDEGVWLSDKRAITVGGIEGASHLTVLDACWRLAREEGVIT